MTKEYFWKIESEELIFRSEIMVYPLILKILKKLPKNKKYKILDAECGTGKLSRIISFNKNFKIYGIDKSKEAIKIAKENFKGAIFQEGNVTKLRSTFKKEKFDIVISTFVTLYLNKENLKEFFEQVSNVLEKNGLFILADVHPFLPIIQPKTNWEKWNFEKMNYFKTQKISQSIFLPKGKLGKKRKLFKAKWYHHPLDSYLNSLISAGFDVQKIYEPKPNKEILRKYKNMWNEERTNPVYLMIKATKK